MRTLFVTGTDTGVGKTYVSCLLLKALAAAGAKLGASAAPVLLSDGRMGVDVEIIDFGKWKYEQAKHEKEKHKTKASKVKEVKLRVGIDPHDYKIKLTRAEDFQHLVIERGGLAHMHHHRYFQDFGDLLAKIN